ncbi:MAG: hypothetical protein KAR42_01595 [candidate division Zixibacteria bacterium]|nr:hypothetical protein [candidate division Zixibacteria bacterium]
MKRLIPYILYLYLIAMYRILLADALAIGPVQIYLTPLIVMLVALNKDYIISLWFGIAAGLIFDCIDPSHMGVQMIILSAMGIVTSRVKERFNLESQKSLVLLLATGLLIFTIPHTLIYTTSGFSEFGRIFIRVVIPGIIYSTSIGWLYFMIKTSRISFHKIKELF